MNSDFKNSLFSCEHSIGVIFWKGNLDISTFTRLRSFDPLFKPWNHLLRTQIKLKAFGSTAIKWLTLHLALKIDDNLIPQCRGAIYLNPIRMLFTNFIQSGI